MPTPGGCSTSRRTLRSETPWRSSWVRWAPLSRWFSTPACVWTAEWRETTDCYPGIVTWSLMMCTLAMWSVIILARCRAIIPLSTTSSSTEAGSRGRGTPTSCAGPGGGRATAAATGGRARRAARGSGPAAARTRTQRHPCHQVGLMCHLSSFNKP